MQAIQQVSKNSFIEAPEKVDERPPNHKYILNYQKHTEMPPIIKLIETCKHGTNKAYLSDTLLHKCK